MLPNERAPAYFGTTTGAPVTVAAALLGLFGNDDAQYGRVRTHRIEVRQRKWPPTEAALFEGNANPFFAFPCDMAWMLNGIAADHENEVIWNAKRAGDFKGCSGAR